MGVAGEDDHLRSPGCKTTFDGHLHWVAFKDAKQLPEWHVTVEIREFRRIVTVEAIVPSSGGSEGLHPKAETTLFAETSHEPVLTCSGIAVDDVDFRLGELPRRILRGGLELGDPLDTSWMLEELLGVLVDELSERSLSEALKERDEIAPWLSTVSGFIIFPSE